MALKVKKKKDCMIPSSDSYKGLSYDDWELPTDFRELFNKDRYGKVGDEITLNV